LTDNDAAADVAAEGGFAEMGDESNGQDVGTGSSESTAGVDDVEALRRTAEENWNKYLRSVAELENLRRRNAREIETARKFGAERLVAAILPVRDSLEAGLKAVAEGDPASIDIGSIFEGEQATLRLLDQALASVGVAEIAPEGEPFDPECHEAMSMMPSPTAEPNSVIAVVQKGYLLHDRVVRPARVIVARPPPEGESA